MGKLIGLLVIGIILATLGIFNIKGNVSSIHWYNRRRVAESDLPKYGKCIGSGSLIIGLSLVVPAILEAIFHTAVFDILLLLGCIVGFIVMLYAQIKYNKGIF